MKRIIASQIIENKVIKEFGHIEKLEDHIQYDLLRAIAKEALDHKLIKVEKSNERMIHMVQPDIRWKYL